MAKKLSEISKIIESSVSKFEDYLTRNLPKEVNLKIDELGKETQVYIFSGLIRNFFLNIDEVRDIDIVLGTEVDIGKIFTNFKIEKNSFDGFKISKGEMVIDLWFLEKTWALQHQKTLSFDLDKYIPSTAFFNFSSIVFAYNEQKFYYTDHFVRFLRDKEIDVVYEPNANYTLCIVNTLYYADKYSLKISDRLKKHIIYLDRRFKNNYELVQLNHFGKILYTTEIIKSRLMLLTESLPQRHQQN